MVGKGTADRTVDIQDGGGGGGTGGLTDAELRASAVPVTTQEPISVDDNGASLTVDGTVAVSNFPATQPISGTVDTELPPAAALADNTPNPTVPGVAAFGMVFDGANWDRMSGDDTGIDVKGPLTDAELRANPVFVGLSGSAQVEGAANDGFPPGGAPVLVAGQDGTNVQSLKTDTNGELQVDVLTLPKSATATLTNVNDSASSVSLLALNTSRIGVTVFNDSTTDLYLKYGATASTTSFTVKILAGGYWEMPQPIFTGALDGIWSADASGAARITELT